MYGSCGIYLYGSLAMGCFHLGRSDVDLLIVLPRSLAATKKRLAELLMSFSNHPAPLEVSFLTAQSLRRWRHPAPFEFHFGEDWRARYELALGREEWRCWHGVQCEDPDLAANITVARARGVTLYGSPVQSTLPRVPESDYLAAALADRAWARARIAEDPAYAVLNHCRTLAYLREKRLLSKAEAGEWTLTAPPERYPGVVALALEAYAGRTWPDRFDQARLERLLDDER